MKTRFLIGMAALTLLACNQPQPAADTSKQDAAKALFEKNLASVKAVVSAFEKEDIDALASNISDTAVWITSAYGSGPGKKSDWTKALSGYMADWDSLKLVDPIFLPGVNQKDLTMDGSVRYYGLWVGVHKSGVKTTVNFYGSYDFNTDNKIINGAEFFDLGGLMNAVKPKK